MLQENTNVNSIYKVNNLVDGKIDSIYVFYGKNKDTKNKVELIKQMFTDDEINQINSKKINIIFSEQQIHYDDTISTIKIKILNELKTKISIEEIYLFSQKLETLNAISVYQSLTQNKKIELTNVRLQQFISNIISEENGNPFNKPPIKDIYTFDDILEMKFNDKKYIINKVLGQKFFLVENEYPFVCNPFLVHEYDALFEKNVRKSLSTLNSHLLLNNGEILNNNIFLCLTKNVLNYLSSKDISEKSTVKIYYPFLYNKNINNLEELQNSQNELIENNRHFLNEKTTELFKTVSMFYDIYKLKKTNLNYIQKGIKYIKAILKPDFFIKIPLEIIFKIIHATKNSPLIKYNPSTRQENIYRLYTNNVSTDGRKIPYLKKAIIFKLMKTIAKTKSVSVYIELIINDSIQSVNCEFDENGFITITSEFESPESSENIDNIFRESVNPVIQEIKNTMEQSGYKFKNFHSLLDDNVEVSQITYETQIKISKPIDLLQYKGCVSAIFNNESSEYTLGIHLRFKRVSNFNKVTSQEAFILEKSEQGYKGTEIIEALLENFKDDLDRNQAEELVRKVANEIQLEKGIKKTEIKIKDNPGFKTTITLNQQNGIITIIVENINDINYLSTIPIYLDSIIRLTQDKKSTLYPTKEINKLCYTDEKEEIKIVDIISPTESVVSENEIPFIENEEIEYTKYKDILEEKPKGAFSLFFDEEDDKYDEDDEDNENEEYNGGKKNSDSSEPSIDSEKSIDSENEDKKEQLESLGFISSEESIPSIKSNVPEEKSEESIPSIKSIVPEKKSEESIPSIKSIVPEKKSEESIPSIKSIVPEEKSEESIPSIKSIVPEKQNMSSNSDNYEIIYPVKKSKKEKKISEQKEEAYKYSSEDENENENEEDDDDDETEQQEDNVQNIDELKLNKPYYFQSLIEKHDPVLILKEDTAEYNAYSRTCSSDTRRQPVILTNQQLNNINTQHPGFLRQEDVVTYGSNPNKQFNYICPRYWCLKNNTIVDPKDLKEVITNGKKELIHPTCGKVLAKGDKKVKPGYYIYEFYQPTAKSQKRYPGFQTDKHPKGFCLPCCFDKYNTEGRIKANKKCSQKKVENEITVANKQLENELPVVNKLPENPNIVEEESDEEPENDEYIKGPDKFPLYPGRWGYLPVGIQTMLHEVNADCQISKTNTNIKQNHPCLLRHGIEINKNQSFIACISDLIFFAKKNVNGKIEKILNVKEMRERIIKSLNIDNFIKYQNGNLVTDFYDVNRVVEINKYNDTKLFKKLNINNSEDEFYYKKVVSAFENFIDFLNDDNAVIDHTYLWDIVSMPNNYIFSRGVNLVILKIPNDDITNNIQLICPTNHYSTEFYEARKPTVILVRQENYYEPIYSYTTTNNKIIILKEFKEYDPQLSKTMRAVFKEIIKPLFNKICRPLDSMPNIYKAKKPLLLYDLIQKLDKYNYTTIKLVVNFNNKVIGVLAQEPGSLNKIGFIPCYPSAIENTLKKDIDYIFMTDLSLWNTYNNTVSFLMKLEKKSKGKKTFSDIPCKPAFKIIEDELIVGILTETNQFIQLSEPIAEQDIDLEFNIPSITNDNYIVNAKSKPLVSVDVATTTTNEVDKERVDYIKKIKMETNFYNVFRNTIRILLNDYENIAIREKIQNEISKEYIIYSEKLKNVNKLLRELVKSKVQFIGDDNYYKLISEISTCIVKDKENCRNTPNLCAIAENENCDLIIPQKNLITNKINEPIYFGRIADEIIRYNRIKTFMFQPQSYISFGNINYNLRDNEIIIIQSMLNQEYFENLIPMVSNKYITHNSYDEVEPIISQMYENNISSLNNAIGKNNETICNKITNPIVSAIWKKCFPKNYTEIEYSKFNYCTIVFIIDLIERKTGEKVTVNQIKNELYTEYKKYLPNYNDKIIDILISEGKKTLGDQVKSDALSFANFIYTDNYFFTSFDLWLLVNKYKIPTIFISQKFILQTSYQSLCFIGYGDESDSFAFIVLPGLRAEIIPKLKLIQSDKNEIFISLNKLNSECVERINKAFRNKVSIEDYLINFTKKTKSNYNKKKPVKLLIVDDEEEEITSKKPEQNLEKVIENVKEQEVLKKRKKTAKQPVKLLIVEDDEGLVAENPEKNKKRKTKKQKIILKGNNKTKKND